MHKAYYWKCVACIKLEEYQTAKAALELGSSYASGDSRFTRLLKECEERIAEESSQAPVKNIEPPVAPTIEDKEDVANIENTPPVVEPPSKPKYSYEANGMAKDFMPLYSLRANTSNLGLHLYEEVGVLTVAVEASLSS
ncbi:protein SGT1 homolog [Miscanthus floridulus]|uniref:protein SGT1 homolog n=1 Tax=Miscanthus floridulus TaxID=154761 RepID=UPI00345A7AE6